jgi:hypothetical protein
MSGSKWRLTDVVPAAGASHFVLGRTSFAALGGRPLGGGLSVISAPGTQLPPTLPHLSGHLYPSPRTTRSTSKHHSVGVVLEARPNDPGVDRRCRRSPKGQRYALIATDLLDR